MSASGTVQLASSAALSAGSGVIELDGGTFQITGGASGDALADGSPLVVNAPAVLDLNGNSEAVGSLAGSGTIQSNSAGNPTLSTGGNNATTTFTGALQGTGGGLLLLDKVGNGSMILGGIADNSGTQATVDNGTLVLAKNPSSTTPDVHAVGRLTINNGGTAQLAGSGGDQIYDGDPVGLTVKPGGVFDLKGKSETVSNVHLTGGTISDTVGAGVLTSTSAIDVQSGSASAILAGTSGLIKNTIGTLTLSGSNTFGGGVTINSGTLQLGSSGALNSSAPNAVSFGPSSTGVLQLHGNSVTIVGLSTDVVPGSPIVENSNVTGAILTVANSGPNTFAGVLRDGSGGGALNLAKSSTGVLTLSGADTYTGGTAIQAGTVQVGATNALPTGTTVTLGSNATNGTLDLGGFNQQIGGLAVAGGALSGSQTIANSSTTANSTLTFSGGTSSFGGILKDAVAGGTKTLALTVSAVRST